MLRVLASLPLTGVSCSSNPSQRPQGRVISSLTGNTRMVADKKEGDEIWKVGLQARRGNSLLAKQHTDPIIAMEPNVEYTREFLP